MIPYQAQNYVIDRFLGIDQSQPENRLNAGFTPDCANMDTTDGNLAVGYGFKKHISTAVPSTGTIWRMYHWHTLRADLFIVCAGDKIYAWDGAEWDEIFNYTSLLPANVHINTHKWDFVETRIGSDDNLIIANGQTQLVTYDGTTARAFGTGEFVFEGYVSAVEYNAVQADSVSQGINSNTVEYTLTMPADWVYAENCIVAFKVPTDYPTGTLNAAIIIGGNTYNLKWLPIWSSGDTVMARLATGSATATTDVSGGSVTVTYADFVSKIKTSGDYEFKYDGAAWKYNNLTVDLTEYGIALTGTPAENNIITVTLAIESEAYEDEPFGIVEITLSSAPDDAQKARCLNVGIHVNDEDLSVKDVSSAVITLSEPYIRDIQLGVDAKIRGGVSDIKVNYVEMYFGRLFSAGDPEHPSRLYWSQPAGDTRTIEDWSQDVASDSTSGGYTEVGQTSSDPIVGITALSNQLIVYKTSSVYRLMGDRPTNYRVMAVNRDMEPTVNTAIIANGDVPYWLTKAGMYYHDGQTAHLMFNARQIHTILESVDISRCKGCENRDRLYFTCRAGDGELDDTIIVYDMRERTYLLRNGFKVIDLCSFNGVLYMINGERYVYEWDKSCDTYDGEQIDAYWYTPFTDLGSMSITKMLRWMYARGDGKLMNVDTRIGKFTQHDSYMMPEHLGETIQIPLKNQGRVFGFKIYNEAGSRFTLYGGVEVKYEVREE